MDRPHRFIRALSGTIRKRTSRRNDAAHRSPQDRPHDRTRSPKRSNPKPRAGRFPACRAPWPPSLAVGLSVYALYWVIAIVEPQVYRVSFLLVALVLSFLLYPAVAGSRCGRQRAGLAAHRVDDRGARLAARRFWPVRVSRCGTQRRSISICGTLAIAVVLEATRRTVGWILPVSAIVFILYGYYGPLLEFVGLGLFAHRGYRAGPAGRIALHDARRHLWCAARRRRDLHRACSRSTARCFSFPAPASSFWTGRWRRLRTVRRRSRTRPDGDDCGFPARNRLGQRRRHDGDAGIGRLADAAPRGLSRRSRWRHPVRGRALARFCRRRRSAPPRF